MKRYNTSGNSKVMRYGVNAHSVRVSHTYRGVLDDNGKKAIKNKYSEKKCLYIRHRAVCFNVSTFP